MSLGTPYAVRAYLGFFARNRRTWRSAISYAVLSPLLSLAAMGLGVGTLVMRRDPAALQGATYSDFIAPGLLAAAAMQMAVAEASWPIITALRWERTYHAMLATPLTVPDVFYGQLGWFATRLAVGVGAFLVAMVVLGFPAGPAMLLVLPAGVLTGLACATPTAAWAIGRRTESAFALQYRLMVMPLSLFSGTFFPLGSLPAAVRLVVQAFPVWHGVELCRGLTLGGLGPGAALGHTGYLLAVTAAGLLAGRRTFAKVLLR